METLFINNFSAGWTPSDDQDNAREGALLKMNNVELDQNGALVMTNGTKSWTAVNYPSDAHTLYSTFIGGVRQQYLATTAGEIFRNGDGLNTGGSNTRAAFLAAFNIIFIYSGSLRLRDDGINTSSLGVTKLDAPLIAGTGPGTGILTGTYQYATVAVYNPGNGYVARAALSNYTEITVENENVNVDTGTPLDAANEIWTFRRGGDLDNWYRIYRATTTPEFFQFEDGTSDIDALELGITANIFIQSTNAAGISDDILGVVGLVNQRAIMFTSSQIYFSEINSPDSYDVRTTINIGGSNNTGSETFLWARKVSENIILISTTQALYTLTGTYVSFPDGTLDVYLRTVGSEFPSIGKDAAVYNNSVIYMAKQGWRILSPTGESVPLCPPNTDTLYRGNTKYDYGVVPTFIFPTLNYSCCVAKEKLWTVVPVIVNNDPTQPFDYRMEVYDFIRKYWRVMTLKPTVITAEQDGAITGFFSLAGPVRNLRQIDHPPFANEAGKTINGSNQIVDVLFPFKNNGKPNNNKDSLTFTTLIYTGGDDLTCQVRRNSNSDIYKTFTINTSSLQIVQVDIKDIPKSRNYQIELFGQVSDFELKYWALDYELHPLEVFNYSLLNTYYGPFKKRARVWPIVLDTQGTDVTFTPTLDGGVLPSSTFNSEGKRTHFHHFTFDAFGIDYGGSLNGTSGVFEVYNILDPEFVQTLPMAKRFDQVGPSELFRYGKLRRLEFRILAFGGSTIPYVIYEEDINIYSGSLTVTNSREGVFEISLPKGIYGQVLRIELGPTDFDFHRLYTRVQASISGKDTEMVWRVLETQQE